MRHDRDVTHLEAWGRGYQQGYIESRQGSTTGRRHVVSVDRPVRMDLLDKGLERRLLFGAPVILLQGRLIDESVPRVGDHRPVGEFDCKRSAFRAGLAPGADGRRRVGPHLARPA